MLEGAIVGLHEPEGVARAGIAISSQPMLFFCS